MFTVKKKDLFQINNLTLHFKKLGKKQTKHNASRRKEIIKLRAEITEIQNKKLKNEIVSRI